MRWANYFLATLLLSFTSGQVIAQEKTDAELLTMLKKQSLQLNVTSRDLEEAQVSSNYADQRAGMRYVYLQQFWQGVKVYNGVLSVILRDNQIIYSSSAFIKHIAEKAPSAVPNQTSLQALIRATGYLHIDPPKNILFVSTDPELKKNMYAAADIAKKNIETQLVWLSTDNGLTVHLAWTVNIDVLKSSDWWNVQVDATDGAIVSADNWTVNEKLPYEYSDGVVTYPGKSRQITNYVEAKQPRTLPSLLPPNVTDAAYKVVPFPIESPNHGAIAVENNPWLKAGAGNNAITNGWHFDGTTNYTITRGNNVFAFLDVSNNNVADPTNNWPDTSTTAAPTLSFQNTPNFSAMPTIAVNKKFEIDNLFYWNNLMHDVYYQYGFTEAAGNFQKDNLSRGGNGNDFVNANAQDGSGWNNANFNTPIDGSNSTMQMYLFNTNPVFSVTSPAGIAGTYAAFENVFTTTPDRLGINVSSVTGDIIWYIDANGTTHQGCTAASNAAALNGKIALIDGTTNCIFTTRAIDAQNAGAIAAIIYSTNTNPITMSGSNSAIHIPVISVSLNTANTIITQLNASVTVTATMGPGNPYPDGDVDNGVICHEYGHGISNRFTGGPYNSSCLGNAEEGGEGWSDYLAMMMTTNWATATTGDGALAHPIGTYVLQEPTNAGGIRRYPYSTNMTTDPLTYSYMDGTANGGEVHNIGEIWCSALWDLTWNIIQQTNTIDPNLYNSAGTGGNVIALNDVMMGMRLQKCQPGFLDARNAILAADSILYNYAHKCAIWNAFARRGMGYSATQGLSTSTSDHVPAFDLPTGAILTKSATPVGVNNGNQITITHTATCNCQAPLSSYILRDTIPTGFSYVSSTGGSLSGNIVTFSPVDFTTSQEAKTYSITIQPNITGIAVDTTINDDRDTHTTGGLSSSILSGSTNWVSTSSHARSGSNSWGGPDPGSTSSFVLKSSSFTVGNLSIFSFWHFFNTEGTWDGGVVELSNNGTTWSNASPYMVEYPTATSMDPSSPFGSSVKAFSGNNVQFVRTVLNLTPLAGQTLFIRFRMTADATQGGEGWFLDDIMLLNGKGGILKTGLYNASNVRVDTSMVPLFIKPVVALPLTLVDFTAKKAGVNVQLNWQSVNEVNTAKFSVEHSIDGAGWTGVGIVPATGQGSGNYQFLHTQPVKGMNFYRLKMIDIDGQFKYSPVRTVVFDDVQNIFTVAPNPANSQTILRFGKTISSPDISVYDVSGRLVQQFHINGFITSYLLSIQNLATGTYSIIVRTSDGLMSNKLVIAK